MNLNPENFVLVGAILLFCSVLAGKTGYKFGLPALLLFLGVGMFFGCDGPIPFLQIQFDSPKVTQFIGVIALSIICFREVWIPNSKT